MKTLYLIRHAKSSWSNPNLKDHDRPLNDRGERDKTVMAKFIRSNFKEIELIVSSTATRALDYAACIHKYTNVPLDVDEMLYTFSSSELLNAVYKLPDNKDHIAVVTHNPAATEVINHLSNFDDGEKIVNLPTAAIIKIEFEQEHWAEITNNSGAVVDFAKPKGIDSFEDDLD